MINPSKEPSPFGANRRVRQWFERWLPPACLLVLLAVIWELAVRLSNVPGWMLPAPTAVVQSLARDRQLLWDNTRITTVEVLIGFVVAVIVGLILGLVISVSPVLFRAVYPLVVASQTAPVPAIAPLLLIWFGYGLLPKILVTALVGFFPIVVSTVDGLQSADRETLKMIRAFGGSRLVEFRLVRWPGALPAIFSGARIAIAVCVIGAVFGEFAGSNAGLGYLMIRAIAQFQTARVIACIVILSLIGIILFGLVGLAERWLLPWRRLVILGDERR